MVVQGRRVRRAIRGSKGCRGRPGKQELRDRVGLMERRGHRVPPELQGKQDCQGRREIPEIKVNISMQ